MTKMNFDDARLTAFALGELPVGDAALLEEALADNPALAEEVAAIRATAGLLHSEFAAEAATSTNAASREQVSMNGTAATGAQNTAAFTPSATSETPAPPPLNSPLIFRPRRAWAALGLAAAACFVVAVIVTNSESPDRIGQHSGRENMTNGKPGESINPPPDSSVMLGLALDTAEDKQRFISQRLSQIEQFQRELKLEEALLATDEILAVDPDNAAGQGLRQAIQTTIDYRKFAQTQELKERGLSSLSINVQQSSLPPARALTGSPAESGSSAPYRVAPDFSKAPSLDLEVALAQRQASAARGKDAVDPSKPGSSTGGLLVYPEDWPQLSKMRPSPASATPAPFPSGGTGGGGGGGRDAYVNFGGTIDLAWQTGPTPSDEQLLGDIPIVGEAFQAGKLRYYDTDGDGKVDLGYWFDANGELKNVQGFGSPVTPSPEQEIAILEREIDKIEREMRDTGAARIENPGRLRALMQERARCEAEIQARAAGEQYNPITDNPFIKPLGVDALSTFSIDVDTASYANVRKYLFDQKTLPPKDAVRIEELINYFDFDYEAPSGEAPFSTHVEVNVAPWKPDHRLVKIGLRGKDIKLENRPATNLVFLIDVSGSMNQPDKLPLVKESLKALVNALHGDDRLAIVTYAGNAGLAMNSLYVNAENKPSILAVIDNLSAGGGTNGAGGIQVAYNVAQEFFIKQGVNRVILCTDGDFNVGVSNQNDLVSMIEEKRTSGVYLSVLGFGTGNLQDGKMEQLANHGNGAFAYIDTIDEGRRVLVEKMAGTLVTIAKDVKIQVEFNPSKVQAYRLIGYENRVMAAQDFNDDRKDAGEIGAGHTVTALYEVVPVGVVFNPPPVDDLKYQKPDAPPATAAAPAAAPVDPNQPEIIDLPKTMELLTVKLRYKQPDAAEGAESVKIEMPVNDPGEVKLEQASADFQFAAAVAGYGMILRDSPHRGAANLPMLLDLAGAGMTEGHAKQRGEFMQLIEQARAIKGQ